MSLRGVVSTIGAEDQSKFDEFVQKMKKSFQDLTGADVTNQTDTANGLFIDGIVQGEIKFQALNDWKTTLFYGFSDAASNVGISGTNASSIIKFANTVGNVLGYTLGGTGPASKKMYGGSNLNGFSVQFKWYTPYMSGWQQAIQNLTYMAWPSSFFEGDQAQKLLNKQNTTGMSEAETKQQYSDIIVALRKHSWAISEYKALLKANVNASPTDISINLAPSRFPYDDIAQLHSNYILHYPDNIDSWLGKLDDSYVKDGYVKKLCEDRQKIQMRSSDVGKPDSSGANWYDSRDSLGIYTFAPVIDGGDRKSTRLNSSH